MSGGDGSHPAGARSPHACGDRLDRNSLACEAIPARLLSSIFLRLVLSLVEVKIGGRIQPGRFWLSNPGCLTSVGTVASGDTKKPRAGGRRTKEANLQLQQLKQLQE